MFQIAAYEIDHSTWSELSGQLQRGVPMEIIKRLKREIRIVDLNERLTENCSDCLMIEILSERCTTDAVKVGDILIINRAIEPKPGDTVVARLNDGYIIKKQGKLDKTSRGGLLLVPDLAGGHRRHIKQDEEFHTLGVVIWTISRPR